MPRWMWSVTMVVVLAGVAGAQERERTSLYFECPYINYFDGDCPQLEREEARAAPAEDEPQPPAAGDAEESEHDWLQEVPEHLLPLFPKESLAPELPCPVPAAADAANAQERAALRALACAAHAPHPGGAGPDRGGGAGIPGRTGPPRSADDEQDGIRGSRRSPAGNGTATAPTSGRALRNACRTASRACRERTARAPLWTSA